ncbi:MAG: PadR family transcriptional regulator [Ruminococcus sp.]
MNISKELIKGSTSMLVLSVLKDEDLYGYKIIKKIESLSEDVFVLKEGTLYPILHALEKEKFLESYWDEKGGRKRKFYHITKKGLNMLKDKAQEWQTFSVSVNKVLGFATN